MEEESVLERRNTKQRQLVLEVVRQHGGHISADEVYLKAREIDPSISRGTIYRNLKLLGQSGEIKQVRLPGADQFDVRTDRHDHLICNSAADWWTLCCHMTNSWTGSLPRKADAGSILTRPFSTVCVRNVMPGKTRKRRNRHGEIQMQCLRVHLRRGKGRQTV
jgi:Fe2+ or Zn2+ uptake regulation protein